MSRGSELQQARSMRRIELTRVWENEHPDQALTTERLAHYASELAGGNRCRLIQTSLLIRQLNTAGVSTAEIPRAFHIDEREVLHHRNRPLVAPADVVKAIEAQVVDELPETPEPDRYVPDTGQLYSTDPLWAAKAAAIDRALQAPR